MPSMWTRLQMPQTEGHSKAKKCHQSAGKARNAIDWWGPKATNAINVDKSKILSCSNRLSINKNLFIQKTVTVLSTVT